MGYNLRWDRNIAKDADFRTAFGRAYDSVDAAGMDSTLFRGAWEKYIADKLAGIEYPVTAGEMMAGFMLGAWLSRVTPADAAVQVGS